VDISKNVPLPDQVEAVFGQREVDCGVDCVGFEAHGYGPAAGEDPATVINGLFQVVRAPAGMGVLGVYSPTDSGAKAPEAKQGKVGIDFGKEWVKSPSMTAGQCPVMKYNRDLMMAILWGRMDYLSEVVNVEFIPLEKAPEAYRIFDEGASKKYVIDPHGSVKKGA
jgi:glutathione-independent formaldehyde dehydrogenase